MYLLYIIPPSAPHTYDFVVLTSLTHPRKILLVLLQIGKAKDLSGWGMEWIHLAQDRDRRRGSAENIRVT
jgi:hypothetical protein